MPCHARPSHVSSARPDPKLRPHSKLQSVRRLALGFALGLLAVVVLPAGAVKGASVEAGQAALARLEAASASGELTAEQALVYALALGFAPETVPARYQPSEPAVYKCATALIAHYESLRKQLPAETVKAIDGWLAPAPVEDAAKSTYISPSGHFQFTYYTFGTDAVPTTDTSPANGVPDYVEKVAGYCDQSWLLQIGALGFTPPPIGTGTYQVNFEAMPYYGYTTPLSSPVGATRITLHNTFLGFPPNMDPEGNQWGAAKVTVAHEFKHASQRAGSLWSEGDWVELDATWMEDIGYDYVNDYYNYLSSGSPISSPGTPLDNGGGGGTYEDCVWQHWLSETWGNQLVVDFWHWRKTHQTQPVIESYNQMLVNRSSSVALGWPVFTSWNYETGLRAVPGFGYGEASFYPTGPVTLVSSYPATVNGSVQYMAAIFVRCTQFTSSSQGMRVVFNGTDGTALSLAAVITKTNGTGLLEPIVLDAANEADAVLTVALEEIAGLGFVIGNGGTGGPTPTWSLTMELTDLPQPLFEVNVASIAQTLTEDGSAHEVVEVTNAGDAGSQLNFTATVMAALPAKAVAKNVTGSTVSCSPTVYTPGASGTLTLTVTNASIDEEWLAGVSIDFPPGVTVNGSTDFVGGSDGPLTTDGSTGDGVVVTWLDADGEYGNIYGGGEQAVATVDVTFSPTLFGSQSFSYSITGDLWGGVPHVVTGSFALVMSSEAIIILLAPEGGALWPVGGTGDIAWTSTGDLTEVRIEVSRDGGGNWETVAASTPNDGAFAWPVTGPVTGIGQVRVTSLDGTIVGAGDVGLTIYDPVSWLVVSPTGGSVAQGATAMLDLAFDATGLLPGDYQAVLVLHHDAADSPRVIPVDLTVRATTDVGGSPPAFVLRRNHPNPFNPQTTVSFSLPERGPAVIEVFDLHGRLVRTLLRRELPAGETAVVWDGRDDAGRPLPSGAYLARLASGERVATRKMMLAK